MRSLFAVAGIAILLSSCGRDDAWSEVGAVVDTPYSDPRLIGVWESVEWLDGGFERFAAPVGVPSPPGLRIFTPRYFAYVAKLSNEPRDPAPEDATADELWAVYGPFAASIGSYEVHGDTIVMRTTATKNPRPGDLPRTIRLSYRIVGDSLWVGNLNPIVGGLLKLVRIE